MGKTSRLILGCLTLIGVSSFMLHAAQDTIPERLARAGRSLNASAPPPSGVMRLDDLLRVTDVIAKGRVGKPRGYLSKDQREIYTDYPILNPSVLYRATLSNPKGSDLDSAPRVTMRGGSVTINGLTYTESYEALPSLEPGTECLFLLRRIQGQYRLAGRYYGVFRLDDDRLRPLVRDQQFAIELRNDRTARTITSIVERRLQIGQ